MIITRAPMRISFFGGGTDYPEYFLKEGGAVLATAIDKFTYVTANPFPSYLFDYTIRVSYRKTESVQSVEEIEHAVFRECLRMHRIEKDIELHTFADLPSFAGLGSSSGFTVALLQALHAYKGEYVPPLQLAYEAIYVERYILKENVGCQDQTLAAVGGFNLLEFRKEDDIVVHRVPISHQRLVEFEQHLVLVPTGITRRASDVAGKLLKVLDRNKVTLKEMRAMVDRGWDILTGNRPLSEFGRLLHQAWVAKRSLEDSISNEEIDRIYAQGLEAGAYGGKLLGAGAGGFFLFFAPPEVHTKLGEAFAPRPIVKVGINAPGSEVIFATV
jgi:D-glycero-alpha-D-manno-heptose-7-phosphate kinase